MAGPLWLSKPMDVDRMLLRDQVLGMELQNLWFALQVSLGVFLAGPHPSHLNNAYYAPLHNEYI